MFEDQQSMRMLDYPPHITFAIYEHVDREILVNAARALAAQTGPICIIFDAIRFFDANPLVLWASPQDASKLRLLHATVHLQVSPAKCHEHYRPKAWIPHCTLGTHIQPEHRNRALAFADEPIEPFEVTFDRLDCVTFPPVRVVDSTMLASA